MSKGEKDGSESPCIVKVVGIIWQLVKDGSQAHVHVVQYVHGSRPEGRRQCRPVAVGNFD